MRIRIKGTQYLIQVISLIKNGIKYCVPLILILAVSAYAKPQPPSKPITADDIVARMKIQLELTDQQVGKVKPIIENYLAKEKQLKLEEKKQLGKVLTGQQLFTWNFLQNESPREKKKR
jgi:hypothetical protein